MRRAQLHDEARPRVDEMRIFRWLRQNADGDILAADVARDRAEIRQRGHDVECCGSGNREDRQQDSENENLFFHVDLSLELMCTVRTEDEFELKENRIDVAARQEKIFLEEIMIVLQTDF